MSFLGMRTGEEKDRQQHDYDVDMLQREQQFNAEQSQIAYDRQREFYDYQFSKESVFNSPAAQMQRYKAAGLNPFLANTDNGNTSVSATSPSAASASGSNTVNMAAFQSNALNALSNVASIAQGFASLDSQMTLNKSQSNLNDVNAAKAAGVDTDKVKSEIAVNSQAVATQKSQEKLNYSQSNKVDADFREVIYNLEHLLPAKEKELLSNVAKTYSDMQISQNTSKAQIAKMYQDIAESISNVGLNEKKSALVQKELDAFEQRLENELNISTEQFQMMQNQNNRLKIESEVMQRLMKPRNGVESVEGISDFVKLMLMSVLGKLH